MQPLLAGVLGVLQGSVWVSLLWRWGCPPQCRKGPPVAPEPRSTALSWGSGHKPPEAPATAPPVSMLSSSAPSLPSLSRLGQHTPSTPSRSFVSAPELVNRGYLALNLLLVAQGSRNHLAHVWGLFSGPLAHRLIKTVGVPASPLAFCSQAGVLPAALGPELPGTYPGLGGGPPGTASVSWASVGAGSSPND